MQEGVYRTFMRSKYTRLEALSYTLNNRKGRDYSYGLFVPPQAACLEG